MPRRVCMGDCIGCMRGCSWVCCRLLVNKPAKPHADNLPGSRPRLPAEIPEPRATHAPKVEKPDDAYPPAAAPAGPSQSIRPVYREPSEFVPDDKLAALALQPLEGGLQKLHIVVLGHVDAGKSTLMGRLIHDLGFVDARTQVKTMLEADKAGKGSFGWAWVLDERPEERARGITVDVSMQRFKSSRCAFAAGCIGVQCFFFQN